MAVTALDPTTALVVVDPLKGSVSRHASPPRTDVVRHAGGIAPGGS